MFSWSVSPTLALKTEVFSVGARNAHDEDVQQRGVKVGLGPKSHFP